MDKKPQLVLVYNGNGSWFARATDMAYKFFFPNEYECNLCKITYGPIKMQPQWQEFLAGLKDIDLIFLHRDEFKIKFPDIADTPLPAVFTIIDEEMTMIISAEEINIINNLPAMIRLFEDKLKQLGLL